MEHKILKSIICSRNIETLRVPFWSMFITEEEANGLKQDLREAFNNNILNSFNKEAAIFYAYWWQNLYAGGSPSSEDVTTAIGLPVHASNQLYQAACSALKQIGIHVICTAGRRHFFRTLLSQGGLPINLICDKKNFGNYKFFLSGLIREVSHVCVDWDDSSFIRSLNCTSYLPATFKNESIYDLSLQIVHAIVENSEELLPYDSTGGNLKELTEALKRDHEQIERSRGRKPFMFIWNLYCNNGEVSLSYHLECGRIVPSETIMALDIDDNYQFDVYVEQKYIATYKRVHVDTDDSGNYVRADYRIMNIANNSMLWNGEAFIEVKIKCESGDELYLSVANCYPPNLDYPQVFDKTVGGYTLHRNRDAKNNLILFKRGWSFNGKVESAVLAGVDLCVANTSESVTLTNEETGEKWSFENNYQTFDVELTNIYLDWIEVSNYKLLPCIPTFYLYDDENQRISKFSVDYKQKGDAEWHKVSKSVALPAGLIELKVQPYDTMSWVETFYAIPELRYDISEATEERAVIAWNCPWGIVKPELSESLQFTALGNNKWSVRSISNDAVVPSFCTFIIYKDAFTPPLRISIANPFHGVVVVDSNDNVVKSLEIISFDELRKYRIIQNGVNRMKVSFDYITREVEEGQRFIHIGVPVKEGITSLSNFEEIVERFFNLYGFNSFDRASSVKMSVGGKIYLIRKFVYDSNQVDNTVIELKEYNEKETSSRYLGKIWAYEIHNDSDETILHVLEQHDTKTFYLPQGNEDKSYIVFSGAYDVKRIIPKFYKVKSQTTLVAENEQPEDVEKTCQQRQENNMREWAARLAVSNATHGMVWRNVVNAFDVAAKFRLPFRTFNQIRGAMSSSALFAKFLVAMFYNQRKEILQTELQRLEQEFAISSHWLMPSDMEIALNDLDDLPDLFRIPALNKFSDFVRDLLISTLDEDCAQACFVLLAGGPNNGGHCRRLQVPMINDFCSRAHGHDNTGKDMPFCFILLHNKESYYSLSERRNYHYTMLNAPLRVYEHLMGFGESLWTADIQLRRTINFYRKYYIRTYCEMLEYVLK